MSKTFVVRCPSVVWIEAKDEYQAQEYFERMFENGSFPVVAEEVKQEGTRD